MQERVGGAVVGVLLGGGRKSVRPGPDSLIKLTRAAGRTPEGGVRDIVEDDVSAAAGEAVGCFHRGAEALLERG